MRTKGSCPSGQTWVDSYRDSNGKYVRGYCRRGKNRDLLMPMGEPIRPIEPVEPTEQIEPEEPVEEFESKESEEPIE